MSPGPNLTAIEGSQKGSEGEAYNAYLVRALKQHAPALLQHDDWDAPLLAGTLNAGIPVPRGKGFLKRFPPFVFRGPELLRNELKLYVATALLEPRHASYKWWYDRRPLFDFIAQDWPSLRQQFRAHCFADIPTPMRPQRGEDFVTTTRGGGGNPELQRAYASWFSLYVDDRITQTRTWATITSETGTVTSEFPDGRITMVGELHRWIVVNQEQRAPLEQRNVLILTDLFSEAQVRLTERQKRHDSTINLYKLPLWLREAFRGFLLEKIRNEEAGPMTARALLSQVQVFRDFMYERFRKPEPSQITRVLIEDDFVAWGRARGLRGHNWFFDPVSMLHAAARRSPETWPTLNIDLRALRRGGGERTTVTSQNLWERPAPDRAIPHAVAEQIARHLAHVEPPLPLLFRLALTIGARAEDLHALTFGALREDPDDARFLILDFWQNKVRRWNTKPLLKTDPLHRDLIQGIEEQRSAIIERYGRPTKYLFPVFNGQMEGFCTPVWSRERMRLLCAEHDIRGDDDQLYRFKWHSLRHYRGTQMAQQGQDILAIMLELGHVSPHMAMTYVNRRLDLRKKTLLEKGGGQFLTIEGNVDHHVAELLVRKNSAIATRVAGGACTLPQQLGDWCDHAHACLSCKHFRADASAVEHFESERKAIEALIADQDAAAASASSANAPRSSAVLQTRAERNRTAMQSVNNILVAIRTKGEYAGTERRFRKPSS